MVLCVGLFVGYLLGDIIEELRYMERRGVIKIILLVIFCLSFLVSDNNLSIKGWTAFIGGIALFQAFPRY